jgi:NAD+ synthase (glutamine-hydrolysing)
MSRFGFVRLVCASPRVTVADPRANAAETLRMLSGPEAAGGDVVLFPELGLTGYTCGDLFGQAALIDAAQAALAEIVAATRGDRRLVVVGLPLAVGNSLYNTAAVLHAGEILGVVPKQFLPTYKEFYEARWFRGADGREPQTVRVAGREAPFGIDLLFDAGGDAVVGVEICEDLWMPVPPSSYQALGGATILLNLSASNETVGKRRYRTDLVVGQSGRCMAAYAYAGAGPSESTTDLVFGGHCLIAENGRLLAESARVGDGGPLRSARASHAVVRDVDVEKLALDRRSAGSFADRPAPRPFRRARFTLAPSLSGLERDVTGAPFVPTEGAELHDRCAEVFGIQCAGLAKRVEQLPTGTPLNLGVSGGLDSTLALLVAVKTCDALGLPRSTIRGLTMPGFGTTPRTLRNALDLMGHLGVGSENVDIAPLALQTFRELNHAPFGVDVEGLDLEAFRSALGRVPREKRHDLVFENVQARLRTFLLMSRGFVIGTGDLSELALGWCTYNGDHMSMYNPNASIPKTLVSFLVRYVAAHEFEAGPTRDTLVSIAGTTISPELLPATAAGEIEQATEDAIGPYELHDFFLFNAVRCGYSPAKILFLSDHARFTKDYPRSVVVSAMRTFYTRFFRNQFKRSCAPDGPKVGTVSLSPRGDWRMPSDAEPAAWLDLGGNAG